MMEEGMDALLAMETSGGMINLKEEYEVGDSFAEENESAASLSGTRGVGNSGRGGSKKKKVKKSKKNKPKKAMTPFMVFSKETRKILVAENPGMTFSEIGKELGARWRGLALPGREIYVQKAKEDYQRFLDESEQLEALNPSRKRKTVEQKKQTKKKKSISAYLYFCNAHREQMKARHPDMKMVEIQRLLADKWMNCRVSVRAAFEKQAEADRDKYNADLQIDSESGAASIAFGLPSRMDSSTQLKVEADSAFFQLNGSIVDEVTSSLQNLQNDEFEAFTATLHNSESVENLSRMFALENAAAAKKSRMEMA